MTDERHTTALYDWPSAAKFGRVVPKTKFYEHGNVRAALRERFVNDIRRITWAYKLADSTIRLQATDAVPEIQVFTVETKGGDVGDGLLATIDKAVHFPIIFEVSKGDEVRMVAAHKALGGAGPKVGDYFTTAWLQARSSRVPLPPAIDLPALYESLIARLLPFDLRRGESVSVATGRMGRAHALGLEIATLERRLRNEPQFNRKVQLRHQLLARKSALHELTSVRPKPED